MLGPLGRYTKLIVGKPRVVLLDARMLGYSGVGTYSKNLLENYARTERDLSFRVACPRPESVREFGCDRFTWILADAPIYGLREEWQIPRVAKGSDLLHCPHYNVPCFYRGELLVRIQDLTQVADEAFHRSLPPLVRARPMLNAARKRNQRSLHEQGA
jgi:hypothetical protein